MPINTKETIIPQNLTPALIDAHKVLDSADLMTGSDEEKWDISWVFKHSV